MKKIIGIYVVVLLIINISLTSLAYDVEVTRDNLQEAFNTEEFIKEDSFQNIEVTDSQIIMKTADEEIIIDYDLTDNPTFTIDYTITKGMTKEQVNKEIEKYSYLTIVLDAIGIIQGVSVEDTSAYYLLTSLNAFLSAESSSSKVYSQKDGEEFNAIEYMEVMYADSEIKDSENNIFTESCTKKESNEEIYTVTCKLVINKDSDFSVINGSVEKLKQAFEQSDTEEEKESNSVTENTTQNNITKLPDSGKESNILITVLYIISITSLIAIIAIYIINKKKK